MNKQVETVSLDWAALCITKVNGDDPASGRTSSLWEREQGEGLGTWARRAARVILDEVPIAPAWMPRWLPTNQVQADIMKHRLTQAEGHLYALASYLEGRVPAEKVEALRKAHQAVMDAINAQDIQNLVPEQ